MAQNRGKDFEEVVRKCFEKVKDTSIIRLPDPAMGYLGYRNVCDFIVYHYPKQYFIECKSCHGASLPLDNITRNQREGLAEVKDILGVRAGVLVWFVDHDYTVWVPIQVILGMRENGEKSLNWKRAQLMNRCIEVLGKKKRVFFDYDMEDFFDAV